MINLRIFNCKMGIKKELGKKIRIMRNIKGYTQEKLAEMADISQRALSSIESGENFATAETIDKLMMALEMTTEEFFATNDVKEPQELIRLINKNIAQIGNNSEKLEIIYNLTNSLKKQMS